LRPEGWENYEGNNAPGAFLVIREPLDMNKHALRRVPQQLTSYEKGTIAAILTHSLPRVPKIRIQTNLKFHFVKNLNNK